MGIRCIAATEDCLINNRYKSIVCKPILIFLLQISFWVGRNEQSKAQVRKEGTWESLVRAEIRHPVG